MTWSCSRSSTRTRATCSFRRADASTIGDLAKAVQQLFGDTGTNIIGTRHGEKLFETLMTREERLRSEDMGGYYRVAADNRDLNYDKYRREGRGPHDGRRLLHEPQHEPPGRGGHREEDFDYRVRAERPERDGGREKGMKILVTGAKGFVGRNLCENLKNIRDGKNRTRPALTIEEVFEYDLDTPPAELDRFCAEADFVFNLAGVNRPKDNDEFMQGNFGFASTLLDTLKSHGNTCPVMLSSSIQATLLGRYADSDYGKSKLAGEELFFDYGQADRRDGVWSTASRICSANGAAPITTAPWRPSAITWPTTCPSRSTTAPPSWSCLYIDDLVEEMLDALEGRPHRCELRRTDACFCAGGRYCAAPVTHKVTLGEIVDLLEKFNAAACNAGDARNPGGQFCEEAVLDLSFLSAEREGHVLHLKNERRRPRQLYRAAENRRAAVSSA